MAGNIFISYRRDLDAHFAGRLYDQLLRSFPSDRLFIDVDDIEPGLDFVRVLEEKVAQCDVLLVVIGTGWLEAKDEGTGVRRLDNPDDFVRIEIESALRLEVRVIPVLVDGAAMPDTKELPGTLKPLARRQAVRLTHDSFSSDCGKLINSIKRVLSGAEKRRIRAGIALGKQQQKQATKVVDSFILLLRTVIKSRLRWVAAAAVLVALGAGGYYYLDRVHSDGNQKNAAARYSRVGNFACFGDAAFPKTWQNETTCLHFGCNFGRLDRQACLSLGAQKGSKLVIHGDMDGARSNECWLQQSCGKLRPHRDFTLFRR